MEKIHLNLTQEQLEQVKSFELEEEALSLQQVESLELEQNNTRGIKLINVLEEVGCVLVQNIRDRSA